jgi:POT family proton-dependent oligopeptide transporter
MSSFRNKPLQTEGLPPGIPYIIGNEAAERFSFYGMKSILLVFMTTYLVQPDGGLDTFSIKEAEAWNHLFVASAYFFPIVGGILADAFLGKVPNNYNTLPCILPWSCIFGIYGLLWRY